MIPKWISAALLMVSFYVLFYQYRRVELKRNILNIRFIMLVGALVQVMVLAFLRHTNPRTSQVFFVLALVWLAGGVQLLRLMPPTPPKPSRY